MGTNVEINEAGAGPMDGAIFEETGVFVCTTADGARGEPEGVTLGDGLGNVGLALDAEGGAARGDEATSRTPTRIPPSRKATRTILIQIRFLLFLPLTHPPRDVPEDDG